MSHGDREAHTGAGDLILGGKPMVISLPVPLDQTNDMGTSQVGILGIMAASDPGPRFFAVGSQAIVDDAHQRAPSQSRSGQMCTEQLTSAFHPKFWPSLLINLIIK